MTKNKTRTTSLIALGFLCIWNIEAQESVNSTGGDFSSSSGTVAYSIGQVVYTTNLGGTGTVSQGVQLAYEITSVGIKEIGLNISLSAFPNPTTENLILHVSDYNEEKLSYIIFDLHGKQLISGQIVSEQTQINTGNLPSAAYFVNVVNQESKNIQSFKITKN